MMFRVELVTEPHLDLGRFRPMLNDVNVIDAQRLPPHAKFERAVDKLIDEDQFHDVGPKHLFYGFYYELPFNWFLQLENFAHWTHFRVSLRVDNVFVRGLITAPLDLWRLLIEWGLENDLVQPFTKSVERLLPCK